MSTSESCDVNRHTAQYASPVSVVWQCKLVSGWGLMKRRSAPLYGSYGSERTYVLYIDIGGAVRLQTWVRSCRSTRSARSTCRVVYRWTRRRRCAVTPGWQRPAGRRPARPAAVTMPATSVLHRRPFHVLRPSWRHCWPVSSSPSSSPEEQAYIRWTTRRLPTEWMMKLPINTGCHPPLNRRTYLKPQMWKKRFFNSWHVFCGFERFFFILPTFFILFLFFVWHM